jgi:cytochrome c oxidase assembly protein subunit 11
VLAGPGTGDITVRFDANVAAAMPWNFSAPMPVRVRLGETSVVAFAAKNLSSEPILGTATSNVTPFQAAPYFTKIQCFCFTEQLLRPGEVKGFPVSFVVDPKIRDDPDTRELSTITLSYTFFNKGPAERDRFLREHEAPAQSISNKATTPRPGPTALESHLRTFDGSHSVSGH